MPSYTDEEIRILTDAGMITVTEDERIYMFVPGSPRFIRCECGRWYETDHGDYSLYYCPLCNCNWIGGGMNGPDKIECAIDGRATNVTPEVYWTRDWSKGIGQDIREVRR